MTTFFKNRLNYLPRVPYPTTSTFSPLKPSECPSLSLPTLQMRLIQLSQSLFSSPVLLVNKKDKS